MDFRKTSSRRSSRFRTAGRSRPRRAHGSGASWKTAGGCTVTGTRSTARRTPIRRRALRELRELETDADTEIELESLEPVYTGAEGFWLDASFEWLLYASHESSVTVAGATLLPRFRQAWPAWADRLYDAS